MEDEFIKRPEDFVRELSSVTSTETFRELFGKFNFEREKFCRAPVGGLSENNLRFLDLQRIPFHLLWYRGFDTQEKVYDYDEFICDMCGIYGTQVKDEGLCADMSDLVIRTCPPEPDNYRRFLLQLLGRKLEPSDCVKIVARTSASFKSWSCAVGKEGKTEWMQAKREYLLKMLGKRRDRELQKGEKEREPEEMTLFQKIIIVAYELDKVDESLYVKDVHSSMSSIQRKMFRKLVNNFATALLTDLEWAKHQIHKKPIKLTPQNYQQIIKVFQSTRNKSKSQTPASYDIFHDPGMVSMWGKIFRALTNCDLTEVNFFADLSQLLVESLVLTRLSPTIPTILETIHAHNYFILPNDKKEEMLISAVHRLGESNVSPLTATVISTQLLTTISNCPTALAKGLTCRTLFDHFMFIKKEERMNTPTTPSKKRMKTSKKGNALHRAAIHQDGKWFELALAESKKRQDLSDDLTETDDNDHTPLDLLVQRKNEDGVISVINEMKQLNANFNEIAPHALEYAKENTPHIACLLLSAAGFMSLMTSESILDSFDESKDVIFATALLGAKPKKQITSAEVRDLSRTSRNIPHLSTVSSMFLVTCTIQVFQYIIERLNHQVDKQDDNVDGNINNEIVETYKFKTALQPIKDYVAELNVDKALIDSFLGSGALSQWKSYVKVFSSDHRYEPHLEKEFNFLDKLLLRSTHI